MGRAADHEYGRELRERLRRRSRIAGPASAAEAVRLERDAR